VEARPQNRLGGPAFIVGAEQVGKALRLASGELDRCRFSVFHRLLF
jgi:hypothetical protein